MMLISPPEIAAGLPAWTAFLADLDAAPAPDDRCWAWARREALEAIDWFRGLPDDAPARQWGRRPTP